MVENLSSSIIFLESSIQDKYWIIRALEENLLKCQYELAHFLSTIHKLMLWTLKLNNILGSTKFVWDKRHLVFEDGLSTLTGSSLKLIKSTTIDPKLKFVASTLKGELIVISLPLTSNNLNT